MRKKVLITVALVAIGLVVWLFVWPSLHKAETAAIKLIDTGWLSDNTHGEGIYMALQADTLPNLDAEGSLIGQNVCNTFIGQVLPFVLEKTGKSNPTFVAVTIRRGNSFFGTFWRAFFSLTVDKCGGEL